MAKTDGRPLRSSTPPPARLTEPFGDFYRREAKKVGSLAYVLSGSRTLAEELTQEAFLAAYRRWDEISGYDRPDAWVRRVVANLAASRIRRYRIELRVMARLVRERRAVSELFPEAEAMFWSAVRTLPRRQAQVVALYYLEDRSVADIANTLGCAEGTVKAHLHQARLTLALRLGDASDQENHR